MVVPYLHKLSVFLGRVDVVVGENVLHIKIYASICGNVMLHKHKTVVRGMQVVSETAAPLMLLNYQM